MEGSDVILAWRKGKGSGELHKASDLRNPTRIKDIFTACKEAEGYITADGWEFLFRTWKLEELLDLDLTGWFHNSKKEDAPANLIFQSLMSGYNPLTNEKGDYETETGLFLSLEGRKSQIDWDKIKKKR